jgi:hypothetical protein
MTWARRTVLIVYSLLIVYCCPWVPWHVVQSPAYQHEHEIRVGYGWLWMGPSEGAFYDDNATPDLPIIGLRLLAATALAGIGFAATRKQ